MAFVRTNLDIGDKVRLNERIEVSHGYFESGTELIITGISYRGYDFKDSEGNRLLECPNINSRFTRIINA